MQHPADPQSRNYFNLGETRLRDGCTPGEIELELTLDHQCSRELIADVLPAIRTVYRAKELQEGSYLSWWRRIISNPIQEGVPAALLILMMIPIVLWCAYTAATLLRVENYRFIPSPLLALGVMALAIPVSWCLGYPLFIASRIFWTAQAEATRKGFREDR